MGGIRGQSRGSGEETWSETGDLPLRGTAQCTSFREATWTSGRLVLPAGGDAGWALKKLASQSWELNEPLQSSGSPGNATSSFL